VETARDFNGAGGMRLTFFKGNQEVRKYNERRRQREIAQKRPSKWTGAKGNSFFLYDGTFQGDRGRTKGCEGAW